MSPEHRRESDPGWMTSCCFSLLPWSQHCSLPKEGIKSDFPGDAGIQSFLAPRFLRQGMWTLGISCRQ